MELLNQKLQPTMADRGQEVATAWPPRARLGLTTPRAGRLEMNDALLPLHSPARALPPLHFLRSPALAKPLLPIADAARFATIAHHRHRAVGQSISVVTASSSTPPPRPVALLH